jgi:hypothetical protein
VSKCKNITLGLTLLTVTAFGCEQIRSDSDDSQPKDELAIDLNNSSLDSGEVNESSDKRLALLVGGLVFSSLVALSACNYLHKINSNLATPESDETL